MGRGKGVEDDAPGRRIRKTLEGKRAALPLRRLHKDDKMTKNVHNLPRGVCIRPA